MPFHVSLLTTACLVLLATTLPAPAADRVALVVGCNSYQAEGMALDTPVNDARRMAAVLKGPGMEFEVIESADPTLRDFNRALLKFKEQARDAKVALLYYSGHGMEVDGENYLLPVDTRLEQAADVQTETVAINRVLEQMAASGAQAKLLILDCCRNNPFSTTKSWARTKSVRDAVLRELGEAEIPDTTLVCFATGAGRKAAAVLDETSTNSPFTDSLLRHLCTPGANVLDVFAAVHEELDTATRGRQLPAVKTDNAISPALRKLVLWRAPAAPLGGLVSNPRAAAKDSPFSNSLGMKFVPIGLDYQSGKKVLCSIWETRRRDYAVYATAMPEVDATWKVMVVGTLPAGHGEDHPVVGVSYDDCTAFCAWLTLRERAAGRIPAQDEYRLISDLEWSYAAGIGAEEDSKATPEKRSKLMSAKFPWGSGFPPPPRSGNFGDDAAVAAGMKVFNPIPGYNDGYATTSPVGAFTPNAFGIHDLGGNVWEWCLDWTNEKQELRVQRGSSFDGGWPIHLHSFYRGSVSPAGRNASGGFRVVLVVGAP